MSHVIFVCTGNTFRSMTAEFALRSTPGHQLVASSAGTIARPHRVHPVLIAMLAERGVDCGMHRQTKLETQMASSSHLLVAMGRDHQAYIWHQFGRYTPLFNALAYRTREPVLDLHEAIPDWKERPQAAREYVRKVITHIWDGMPGLVRCVQARLSDRGANDEQHWPKPVE